MTAEMAERVTYSTACKFSEFAAQLNSLRDTRIMKKTSGEAIKRRLIEERYIGEEYGYQGRKRTVYEKGKEIDIIVKMETSKKGFEYEQFYLQENAQRKIVQKFLEEWI